MGVMKMQDSKMWDQNEGEKNVGHDYEIRTRCNIKVWTAYCTEVLQVTIQLIKV